MEESKLKAEEILIILGAYKSKLHLFYLVYIAQELGVLQRVYCFDFSMKIPFCKKLDKEISALFGSEKILPLKYDRAAYRLNRTKLKQASASPSLEQLAALRKLDDQPTEDLIKLALLLQCLPARSRNSKLEDKDFQKVKHELMINEDEVKRLSQIIDEVKECLAAPLSSLAAY